MTVTWGSLYYPAYFCVYLKISVMKVCLLNIHAKEEFVTGLWMTSRQTQNLYYSEPLKIQWNLPGKFITDSILQALAAPLHKVQNPSAQVGKGGRNDNGGFEPRPFSASSPRSKKGAMSVRSAPSTSSPQPTTFLKIRGPYWRMFQLHAKSRGGHKKRAWHLLKWSVHIWFSRIIHMSVSNLKKHPTL